jgi:hypothetical protein
VFHVSPFCHVEGRYRFRFLRTWQGEDGAHGGPHRLRRRPGPAAADQRQRHAGARHARSARKALWRYPADDARRDARIHWQAPALWLKRVPFFRKPAACRGLPDPLTPAMNTTPMPTAMNTLPPRSGRNLRTGRRAPCCACCSACATARSRCNCPTARCRCSRFGRRQWPASRTLSATLHNWNVCARTEVRATSALPRATSPATGPHPT